MDALGAQYGIASRIVPVRDQPSALSQAASCRQSSAARVDGVEHLPQLPPRAYVLDVRALVMYLPMVPVADACAQLSRLIDEPTTTHERFEITRNSRRAAVLLSADDYDTWQETIAVLSDAALLADHREGRAAIDAADYLDADQLTHALREAGRIPG